MQIYTIIGYSPVLLRAIVEVRAAAAAALAAEEMLCSMPGWASVRFVAAFEGRVELQLSVEQIDLVVEALNERRPPPVRRGRGTGIQALTVLALWMHSGETLVCEHGAAWVRAGDGLEAAALVQTSVGRASDLQLVVVIAGHRTPALAAMAGTPPGAVGPDIASAMVLEMASSAEG